MTRPKLYVIGGADVAVERQSILDTLTTLQFVYDLDVYRWEDAVPGFGAPAAALLGEQLPIHECDVVIAVVWRSPGEPVIVDGPHGPVQSYTTIEELLTAIAAYGRNGNGLPRIMIYRKLDDPLPDGGRNTAAAIAYGKLAEFLDQFAPGGRYPAWIYPVYANKFEGIFKKHIGVVLRSLLDGSIPPGHRAAPATSAAIAAARSLPPSVGAMPPYALQDGHSPAEVQTAAAAPQHDPSAEPAPEVRWSALLPTRGNELAAVDELTGPQLAQAQEVFLAAFSREELAQVVFFSVRRRYEEIVARGTFEDEVFELLLWADRQGKVADLVTTARSRNPSNGKLRRLAQSLGLR